MVENSTITKALLEELRDFDTPLLANTIGYVSKAAPHEYYCGGDIQSVTPPLGPTVGVVFTAEIDSSTPGEAGDTALYWELLEMMRHCELPCVLVAKAVGSRPEHECLIGDGMAKTLYSVGCTGMVTDSRVRDIAGLISTPFAVYGRGRAVHHEALRFRHINRPVEISGVTFSKGDVVHADGNGVIRVPFDCLTRLTGAAVKNRAFEHEAHMFLRRTDKTPAEKREHVQALVGKYGFSDCVSGGEEER
ncbi:RraA family protein [Prosthecobacter sp.]|uniref:RraA family protein n=1 Tax=Prosthecobacter sp. TaxID=1965333 RepID=UPI003783CB06